MNLHGMDFPDDLIYDRNNGWIRLEGNVAVHGVTDLGQRIAEKIAFVGLPGEGLDVCQGQTLASFESAKWVDRLRALVSGRVIARNQALETNPTLINGSPYDLGWVAKVEMSDAAELAGLLRADSPELAAYVEKALAPQCGLDE